MYRSSQPQPRRARLFLECESLEHRTVLSGFNTLLSVPSLLPALTPTLDVPIIPTSAPATTPATPILGSLLALPTPTSPTLPTTGSSTPAAPALPALPALPVLGNLLPAVVAPLESTVSSVLAPAAPLLAALPAAVPVSLPASSGTLGLGVQLDASLGPVAVDLSVGTSVGGASSAVGLSVATSVDVPSVLQVATTTELTVGGSGVDATTGSTVSVGNPGQPIVSVGVGIGAGGSTTGAPGTPPSTGGSGDSGGSGGVEIGVGVNVPPGENGAGTGSGTGSGGSSDGSGGTSGAGTTENGGGGTVVIVLPGGSGGSGSTTGNGGGGGSTSNPESGNPPPLATEAGGNVSAPNGPGVYVVVPSPNQNTPLPIRPSYSLSGGLEAGLSSHEIRDLFFAQGVTVGDDSGADSTVGGVQQSPAAATVGSPEGETPSGPTGMEFAAKADPQGAGLFTGFFPSEFSGWAETTQSSLESLANFGAGRGGFHALAVLAAAGLLAYEVGQRRATASAVGGCAPNGGPDVF
jgi:hypothetical protein